MTSKAKFHPENLVEGGRYRFDVSDVNSSLFNIVRGTFSHMYISGNSPAGPTANVLYIVIDEHKGGQTRIPVKTIESFHRTG